MKTGVDEDRGYATRMIVSVRRLTRGSIWSTIRCAYLAERRNGAGAIDSIIKVTPDIQL